MIVSKQAAETLLRRSLAADLDDRLAASSFARRADSLEYSRNCDAGKQMLRTFLAFKPKYHPEATAHIMVHLVVEFPEVNRVALEMVGGDAWLLANAPQITFAQPIDIVIPKEHHIRWYTYGPETFESCVKSIRSSLETWVIPFLDEYTTVESIASVYETDDDRVIKQQQFYISVAAAYVLLQKPEMATQVLEDKLGKAGPRRDYAQAFNYVGNLK